MDYHLQLGDILGMLCKEKQTLLMGIIAWRTVSVIGFLMIPDNPYRHLWWIAFLIDWGCAPGIVYTVIWHIVRVCKKEKN